MADVKWIKITTDIFDDDKILLIESLPDADAIIVIWFKLLCLAGKQNNSGVFIMGSKLPYTEKMLATIFRRKESTVQLALQTFEQFGMIELIDGVITIPNWGKHQSLDQIESKKEYMKNYMKEYREKQKQISSGMCKVNSKSNSKSNVRQADKIRVNKKEIKEEEEGEGGVTPSSPTLEEISDYIHNNNLSVNPNRFFSYYNDRDWKTANNKPIIWQQKLQEWDYDDKQKAKANPNPASQTINNPFLALAKKENLI